MKILTIPNKLKEHLLEAKEKHITLMKQHKSERLPFEQEISDSNFNKFTSYINQLLEKIMESHEQREIKIAIELSYNDLTTLFINPNLKLLREELLKENIYLKFEFYYSQYPKNIYYVRII